MAVPTKRHPACRGGSRSCALLKTHQRFVAHNRGNHWGQCLARTQNRGWSPGFSLLRNRLKPELQPSRYFASVAWIPSRYPR